MAISTNGTVIARLAGGLYNTVISNATYLEVAAQDPSTLANTLFSRWPVIANGKDLWITDNRLTAATMYVSLLSVPWATDELVPQLTELVAK